MLRYIFILVLAVFYLSINAVKGQTPAKYFDTQYTDAIEQCQEQRTMVKMICGSDSRLCMAIVFPEMLRYSLWRDVFETKALELAYVNAGKQVADFSIGWFQMKPSFIEQLEDFFLNQGNNHMLTNVSFKYSSDEDRLIRAERINRLKSFSWQLKYLQAFVTYQRQRLQALNIPEHEQLCLMAAAYNYGSHHTIAELRTFNKQKAFPYGLGKTNPFSYAELAQYFNSNIQLF